MKNSINLRPTSTTITITNGRYYRGISIRKLCSWRVIKLLQIGRPPLTVIELTSHDEHA